MSTLSRSNKKNIKMFLILGLIIAVGVGVYLFTKKDDFGSKDSSAGLVSEVEVEDFKFTITTNSTLTNKLASWSNKPQDIVWNYKVTGKINNCVIPKVEALSGSNVKDLIEEEDPVSQGLVSKLSYADERVQYLTLTLTNQVGCKATEQMKSITETGSFNAKNYTLVKYRVLYSAEQSVDGAKVSLEGFDFAPAKSTSEFPVFQVKGTTSNCYVPVLNKNTDKLFTLRLVRKSQKEKCTDTNNKVSIFDTQKGKTAKFKNISFRVRYVYNDVLIDHYYEARGWESIKKSGYVFSYKNIEGKKWDYKVIGPKGSACQKTDISFTDTSPAKAILTIDKNALVKCANGEEKYSTKGTFEGSGKPPIQFEVGIISATPYVVEKGGMELSYSNIGGNNWAYQITGNLPSNCYVGSVSKSEKSEGNYVIRFVKKNKETEDTICDTKAVNYAVSGVISNNKRVTSISFEVASK